MSVNRSVTVPVGRSTVRSLIHTNIQHMPTVFQRKLIDRRKGHAVVEETERLADPSPVIR